MHNESICKRNCNKLKFKRDRSKFRASKYS